MIASIYRDDPAVDAFEKAIESINTQIAADAFRAHLNFANYLSSKVQSRIYNYALQSATALENPLITSLWQWNQAREQYALAASYSAGMPKSDQAAAAINQARLYVVIGDFVRNLRSQDACSQDFISTADETAGRFATKAVALSEDEPATGGAALEVLAHIAYRKGSIETAQEYTQRALSAYQLVGSLSGIESCYRTLGLIASQEEGDAEQAINNFEVSLLISELLRNQVELTESGSDRAGYFARHAYTNERLIDLLVSKGDVTRAWKLPKWPRRGASKMCLHSNVRAVKRLPASRFLRLPKPLRTGRPRRVRSSSLSVHATRTLFASCPAVKSGRVASTVRTAIRWRPANWWAAQSQFLSSMELRARKMYREAVSGRGFDKTWQDELYRFYLELIPDELRSSLGDCRHLVIIPHHVLHYFPFAALVTEPDKAERGEDGIASTCVSGRAAD